MKLRWDATDQDECDSREKLVQAEEVSKYRRQACHDTFLNLDLIAELDLDPE